ncbi:hypothetical protein CLOAM0880 [Candidatus Cloacimonas acidaminovorans str. Evry]|uniref:Uncharacterized protein n=1 Tax=Cloacimonas acidaminovorans (strain Evry) TaxID=459349 RepID=B0VHE0_CLOAI|nr:hypothetical protein CLOAM0880 [Candidatus Cloacimonas acidaminovorans str. Evry]
MFASSPYFSFYLIIPIRKQIIISIDFCHNLTDYCYFPFTKGLYKHLHHCVTLRTFG